MAGHVFFFGLFAALTAIASGGHIWNIAIGPEWGGHEYFDSKGYLKGFGLAFIDLVCSSGNMDCRIIYDEYTNCWTHNEPGQHPSVGKGLMSRWYDGCIGWVPTVERIHALAFSLSYLEPQPVYFYVKKGNSFNPMDVRGKNIAFLKGWASNEQCLARQTQIQGHILRGGVNGQIKIVDLPKDVLDALNDGTADAFFGSEDTWNTEQRAMLRRFDSPRMSCYLAGNGLMARKDSGVIAAWNVGFTKLRGGNKFNEFCNKTNAEHGHVGTVNCITF